MRKIVADKLAEQVAEWGHRGLIDGELLTRLRARYQTDVSIGRVLLRWLAFLAVFLLGMSIVGFIGTILGSAAVFLASPLLAGLAYVSWRFGTEMVTDPKQTYATSGAVLVTVSLVLLFAALMTSWLLAADGGGRAATATMMLLTSVAAFYTAYRFGLRWPLLLGILLLFHAMGHLHWYGGRGSYFMGINDERATLIFAIAAIAFGMRSEKSFEHDLDKPTVGFGQVYIVVGLLYANMSLWYMTLPSGDLDTQLLFAAAGIAQLVLGARLHDGRFTGFGVVFLSINIYTRMFEGFWDELSRGAFFLVAGSLAVTLGYILEQRARRLREGAAS